ncbi:hypothetical protein P691DRAFT_763626 [Macrolepiota fuliginosa MF-IS2]|uniref:Nephrocystin 3-like N-terminal domain-containing protein n=1 Tax=Macrolepiota fuliginosa MF-IS2 TaxID=1400762 RepID=A0A9P6BXM2_9AGAR|nr:hypothetical protein P691DRAFT_763626 [Macrolepiota fuliginosa MF-IS2]
MPDVLPGAHNFVVNNPTFIANARVTRPGLERLLERSMPDAFHDSSARWPPPLCHPGTRQDYIKKVTGWGIGADQWIFWMHGPAGVGKSAVAQSCADFLAARERLGAAVFLSRPNERNDPDRFFTSISYQIAVRLEPYGDHLNHRIQRDPTLVMKSIAEQFQELFVKPFLRLRAEGTDIGEWIVIVDGLDECGGKDGRDGKDMLPLRWVFLSRPETHIVASFTTNNLRQMLFHLELPVTRAIDNEIRLFLADELRTIQRRSGLPDTWPPAHEIAILVNLSAGLWIYPATLIRFIRDPNSSPVDQLNAVLALVKDKVGKTSSGHPLTELDLFYTLIMRHVPSKILPVIQRILLLVQHHSENPRSFFPNSPRGRPDLPTSIANLLGLSELQFRNACGSLRSVLKLKSSDRGFTFYHASFMDFLGDAMRSNGFCIYSYLNPLRQELFQRLNHVLTHSTVDHLNVDVTWPMPERWAYHCLISAMFYLCGWGGPLDSSTCTALLNFQFHRIPSLDCDNNFYYPGVDAIKGHVIVKLSTYVSS